jgi:peptidoglycan/LPS O-acetylase OafA/YrhL
MCYSATMNSKEPLPYRADIDGLRALAVIAVMIFHAFPSSLKGGFVGVDIFFVISGYLISSIILRDLHAGEFSFAGFYARRIRRIFPALALVMFAVLAFGYFALLADEYMQLGKHVGAGAAFLSNVVLWREAGYFDNASETKPLLHLWSLAVEEQFYIVWPALLYLCWRWRCSTLAVLLTVTALSFAANLASLRYDLSLAFYSPFTRFWELSAGAVLAYLNVTRPLMLRPNLQNAMSWLGLALILAACFGLRKSLSFPGFWALLPVVGACLMIAAGAAAPVNRWLLARPWMVGIGLISYPLYLWHWPLLSLARITYSATPPVEVRVACLALSVALAYATYRLIEKPIRFGAHKRRKTIALCAAMLAIGLAGLVIYRMEGLPQRASIAGFANNKNELIRTPETDPQCLAYVGYKPDFYYCRYHDAKAKHTVALIGDSHAHVTFPGMGEALAARGYNLVLLANSSCPPLKGAVTGNTENDRRACSARIVQMLDVIASRPEITDVFIVTRGVVYMTGNGFGAAENDYRDMPILTDNPAWRTLPPEDIFMRGLTQTVMELQRAGKRVFYLLENPETGLDIVQCITRPLREKVSDCTLPLATVLDRQRDYRAGVANIPGLRVIDPLPAFCPQGVCQVMEDGVLLYADDDHFSLAGSRFVAEKVLKDYLPPVKK